MIFHAMTFHYGDRRSLIELIDFVSGFLAGSMFPLAFLSSDIKNIFTILPFKYLFFTPIEIYLGKLNQQEIISSWLAILAWGIIFYFIFKVVYSTGLIKYEGTGR
jgi:ABC-2 type transport system permease protein